MVPLPPGSTIWYTIFSVSSLMQQIFRKNHCSLPTLVLHRGGWGSWTPIPVQYLTLSSPSPQQHERPSMASTWAETKHPSHSPSQSPTTSPSPTTHPPSSSDTSASFLTLQQSHHPKSKPTLCSTSTVSSAPRALAIDYATMPAIIVFPYSTRQHPAN